MSSYSPSGVQSTAVMRRNATLPAMEVEPWLPRAARRRPHARALGTLTYAELDERVRRAAGAIDAPLGDGVPVRPRPHDLDATAIVVHTSGTTSEPRAVELTFGNWLWSALGSGAALGTKADDVWLCTLPLSHVGGLSILLRSAIYATAADVHERWDTDRALAAIDAGATLVSVVPTTLARLLDAGLYAGGRASSLRCALVGGGPCPPALLERAG